MVSSMWLAVWLVAGKSRETMHPQVHGYMDTVHLDLHQQRSVSNGPLLATACGKTAASLVS